MKGAEQYKDWDVVQKIVSGETELFEIIIRRHNSSLYKIGRSYGYSHEDSQDLMQDAYIDAFTHLMAFENRSSLKTWLLKIMLHKCYHKKQKWNFRNITAAELTDASVPLFSDRGQTDTSNLVMNRELNFVVEQALHRIPMDYRIVFTLREINGLNVAETAESLNITESNVKVRLNRAKTLLRKEVEKSYSAEDVFEFNLVYCDAMVENVMGKIKNIKPLRDQHHSTK